MVQWLTLCAPHAGNLGSIPGQGTRAHKLQLRDYMLQLKIPCATAKRWCTQIKKEISYKEEKKSEINNLLFYLKLGKEEQIKPKARERKL